MIGGNNRCGETIEQLSVPLLACHHHHLLKRQLPGLRQEANGFTAGCTLRQNIQEPVTTQLRFSLQSMAPQTLTG